MARTSRARKQGTHFACAHPLQVLCLLLLASSLLYMCAGSSATTGSMDVYELEAKASNLLSALKRIADKEAAPAPGTKSSVAPDKKASQEEEDIVVQLAAVLHMLNTLKPDGGSRIEAAVKAYE